MYESVRESIRRFGKDERANVFILFGAMVVPLMLMGGGAIEMTRYARYKGELSNALDAGLLALARQGASYSEEQADTFLTNYVNAFESSDAEFTIEDFDITKLSNGFRATVTGSMSTMFLPLGQYTGNGVGIHSLPVSITAEVVNASNRLEVALVFDNTGSMNCGDGSGTGSCVYEWANPGTSSRIYNLKIAAHTLLNTLMPDGGEYAHVKIGMVPFEGAVNIGSAYAAAPPWWVDWPTTANDAKAKYNGQNFGKYDFSANATCTTGVNCKFVGHKWLFNQLTQADASVAWAGCVEMRAEPYDILDTAPNAALPDTLFVPYFWPDEPDRYNPSASSTPYQYTSSSPDTRYNSNHSSSSGTSTSSSNNYTFTNNYLKDKSSFTANSSRPANAQKSLLKYKHTSSTNKAAWHTGQLALATGGFPYQSGPNFGCPRPIVPLTNTKATISGAIDNMVAYYSTGTFIPVGLVWGWHVLSPTEPFTQGIPSTDQYYDQTVRAIVLFTDGENYISSQSSHNKSRHSAYNYTATSVGGSYRLADDDVAGAITELDDKTEDLCGNVKHNGTTDTTDDDVRLYTITFGSMSDDDLELMEDCASDDDDGEPLHYHAPTTSALEGIFREIGEDLSDIHLSM